MIAVVLLVDSPVVTGEHGNTGQVTIWKNEKPEFLPARAIGITAPVGHAGDPGSSLHRTCDNRRGEHIQSDCVTHFLRPAGVLDPALQPSAKWLQRPSEEPGCAELECGFPCPGPRSQRARAGQCVSGLPLGARSPGGWSTSPPPLRAKAPCPFRGGTAVTRCTLFEGLCGHRWKKRRGHWRIPDPGKQLNFSDQSASRMWGKFFALQLH